MAEPTENASVEPELIRGQVAAILNERELVINRGSDHGVTHGMKFRVLTKEDVVVEDPETRKPLGQIVRVKVRVQADAVQERMTICRTYETLRRAGLSALSVFREQVAEAQYRTLKVGDEGFLPPISEKESYIRIGDPVEEIR